MRPLVSVIALTSALTSALICGWLSPWSAAANVAAPTVELVVGADPVALTPTPLIVRDEALDIRCGGSARHPVCTFEAVYTLNNPTDDPVRLSVAFYGVSTTVQRADLGGVALAPTPISAQDAQAAGLPPIERFALPSWGWEHNDAALTRWRMDLEVAPRAQINLTVAGQLSPGAFHASSYQVSAVDTRHPWLASGAPPERFIFHYLIGPVRTWGGAPPQVRVSLTSPTDWHISPGLWNTDSAADAAPPTPSPHSDPSGAPAFTESPQPSEPDTTRLTATIDSAQISHLSFNLRPPPPTLRSGGLLLGVGGRVDDSGGFIARLGYEVAFPAPVLLSLNLDTDFSNHLAVAPVLEVASHSVIIIPSLGLGIGPVFHVISDFDVGVRAQASIQWPFLGFVASFDTYPGLSTSDPLMFQSTLLAQLGF